MVTSMEIHRGEIYYADLDPVTGSEQGGVRPVLVLQNEIGNRHSPTIIVAPITTRPKNILPVHVNICEIECLPRKSMVLLEQIRTLDRSRLGESCGRLDDVVMAGVDRALAISVGLLPIRNARGNND